MTSSLALRTRYGLWGPLKAGGTTAFLRDWGLLSKTFGAEFQIGSLIIYLHNVVMLKTLQIVRIIILSLKMCTVLDQGSSSKIIQSLIMSKILIVKTR